MAAAVAMSAPASVFATSAEPAGVLAVQKADPAVSQPDIADGAAEGPAADTGEAETEAESTPEDTGGTTLSGQDPGPVIQEMAEAPDADEGKTQETAEEPPGESGPVHAEAGTDAEPTPASQAEEKPEEVNAGVSEEKPETTAEKPETVPEKPEKVPEIKEDKPESPAVTPAPAAKPESTAADSHTETKGQASSDSAETNTPGAKTEPASVYVAPSFKRTREIHMTVLEDASVYDGTDEGKEEAGRVLAGVDVRFIKEVGEKWAFIETADEEGTILRGFIDASLLNNKEEKGTSENKTAPEENEEAQGDTAKDAEGTQDTEDGQETEMTAEDPEDGTGDTDEQEEEPAPVTVLKKRSTNRAFTYTYTTTFNDLIQVKRIVSDGEDVAEYAKSFIGNPYKWGGESLTEGCDSSSFTRLIMKHFGVSLPKGTYEQAWEGRMIPTEDARPGDLICYGNDDGVYHVLICTANDEENGFKAVSAASARLGIAETEVDTEKACWACRLFNDDNGSTQASDIRELGRRAYSGDEEAREAIIRILLKAAEGEWNQYGFYRPVLVTQVILESGWCSFAQADIGGIQPEDNNILGMNADLNNDTWESPWTGGKASRYVPQVHNGATTYNFEDMRTYEDIEACLSDYAAFKIGVHPDIANCTDIDTVVDVGLQGYATSPTYNSRIKDMVVRYRVEEIAAEMEAEEQAEALKAAEKENKEDFTKELQAAGQMAVPEEQ